MSAVTALSRLIDTKIREMGVRNQDVAERSKDCPQGAISTAVVAKYRTGRHPAEPTDRILRVLSWTLDIPLPELQRAGGVPESLGDWTPPPEAHQMGKRERAVIEELIRLLVARMSHSDNGHDGQSAGSATYEGTRHIMEEAPAPRELSAEERGAMPQSSESRESGSGST